MQHRIECVKFGKHLKKIRVKLGKTAEKTAHEMGLSTSTVVRIEKGQVDPKLTTLIKIAESLDISVADLLKY